MTRTRLLVVARHAQAEQLATDDLDRRLTPRGRADARAAGEWLAGRGVTPEVALVSRAVRTRQTWEGMSAAAGWSLEPTLDPVLYSADVQRAAETAAYVEGDPGTVLLVGHNPTVSRLAQLLDDGEGAASLGPGGFPPGGLALFEHPGEWADLGVGSARLLAVHTPDAG